MANLNVWDDLFGREVSFLVQPRQFACFSHIIPAPAVMVTVRDRPFLTEHVGIAVTVQTSVLEVLYSNLIGLSFVE
jgi:hypothetical protein